MLSDLVKIIIPVLIGIAGWFVVNWLNQKKDFINKKRELKLNYLIEAYRRITRSSNNPNYNKIDLQDAIQDIQLFGSKEQIKLLELILQDNQNGNPLIFNSLLEKIRVDLRNDLRLDILDKDTKLIITRMDK